VYLLVSKMYILVPKVLLCLRCVQNFYIHTSNITFSVLLIKTAFI